MKRTILLIQAAFFFLTFTEAYSQPVWYWQNPLPQGNDLNSVKFINTATGWAVGKLGIIIRTTNSGTIWTLQSSGTTDTLLGVSFTDANNGTAVGWNGIILRTTNGGTNWISQTSGTTTRLTSVSFTDANNGTAVGYSGTILRTTNGGTNWISQTSGTTEALNGVSFTDVNTGTAVGFNGKIIRTTNGGTTWASQTSGTTARLNGVSFTDANNGTAVGLYGNVWYGYGIILRTYNGGTSWYIQKSGNWPVYGVSFADVNNGTVVGGYPGSSMGYGAISRTTNGGLNWTSRNFEIGALLKSVSFTDANNGTFVGNKGRIHRTTNGGTNWSSQLRGITNELKDIFFINANKWIAVGFEGTIIKTTNRGANWISQTSGTTEELWDLYFTNANTGTIVGGHQFPKILRTTNGGTNWTSQSSGTNYALRGVFFTDANNGIVVGKARTIIKTTNGGLNWTIISSGISPGLNGVYFTDANNGTAVGYSGLILRTTNGGLNWTSQSSRASLFDVFFTDANTGTIVGVNTILRTTNGGLNWISQSIYVNALLWDVFFTDANNGTAVGRHLNGENYEGIILRTTNGGTNWISQTSGTTQDLFGVSFTDANTGTVVGWNGTILSTTNGGAVPIPAAPLLVSPVNNSVGQGLNLPLIWKPVYCADTYRLQLATDVSFSNIILEDSTITDTVKIVTNLSPLTYYYWRVKAKNIIGTGPFSSVWKFKTHGSPTQVNLLHPPDDTTNIPVNVTFIWNKPGEQTYSVKTLKRNLLDNRVIGKYCFELTTDTTGASLIIDSTLTDTTKLVSGLNNLISYYWRVKAENETGWGVYSVWFKFTTVYPPPLAPVLLSPANGALLVEINPLLDWDSSATAESYKIQVSTDSLFTSTVYDSSSITITEFQIPNNGLNINTTYYWRVNAMNAGGTSPWSTIFHFTTGTTNITHNNEIPKEFKLYNSYPNPFNPSTKIKFDIPKSSYVKLIVYDVLGREIATLVNEKMNAGRYDINWDGSVYPSGVYFYRIQAEDFIETKSMVLVK